MTTKELIEMASLDALGLLDEQERDEFERAFRAAAPEVKEQLRREQSRFADIGRWLPSVEPPRDLKDRVLDAVREAIHAVSTPAPAIAGRIVPAAGLARWWNTAPLWRAACIGFATASVVLGGFFVYVSQKNEQIAEQALTGGLTAVNIQAGGQYSRITLSKNYQRVMFDVIATDAAGKQLTCQAVLHLDRETRQAVLQCKDLPSTNGQYAVMIEGAGGAAPVVLKRFQGGAGDVYVPVSLSSGGGGDPMLSLASFVIRGPATERGSEQVIFRARQA